MRKFWMKLTNSLKLQIIVCVTLTVFFTVIYFLIGDWLHKRYEIIKDDFTWVYQIDSMENVDGEFVISGWAFKLNKNAETANCEVLLYSADTGKAYYPEMSYVEREDVNRYFLCEYDYTNSGFVGSIDTKKLDLENHVYEILLRPEENRQVYSTGIYYANGKMMFVDPAKYEPLEVVGTDIENVVENGVLRVCRSDFGMYVYQYDGELYWIAEPGYGFVDGNTLVQYQMHTTQIKSLPQHRLENNWLWSNISFWFTENELTELNTGKYRVAKCALPTEYSVTAIWTGNYIDGWIWQSDFRPWYEFD